MKKTILLFIIGIFGSFAGLSLANNTSDYGRKTIIYAQATQQEKEQSIFTNEMSFTLTKTQLAIGFDNYDLVPNTQVLALLQETEQLASINIIQSIDTTANKDIILHEYLQKSKQIIRQGEYALIELKQELLLLKGDIEECLNDKIIADKDYFYALKEYNNQGIDIALEQSKEYAQCASNKRIEFNAKTEIQKRLNYYYQILSKKFEYLSIKESHIIQSFDTVKEDIIEELNNKIVLENL